MSVYPPELVAAAKKILDNRDFSMLLLQRVADLTEDVVESSDRDQILEAHTELTNIKQFGEWIAMLGEAK